MGSNKIKYIKKFKANFTRLGIYKLFLPFSNLMIFLGYLSRQSRWIKTEGRRMEFNDFYNSHVIHANRVNLYKYLVDKEGLDVQPINYLEFGVGRGNSMRWWVENSKNPDTEFWGFDTFTGLPEDYGAYKKGTFDLEGAFPDIQDERLDFIKGLFQDTLLKTIPDIDFTKRTVIHMDADLYTATHYVLAMLFRYLKKDDIIIFDEFCVPLHEFRAYLDFTSSFPVKLQPMGAINNFLQVGFRVSDVGVQR